MRKSSQLAKTTLFQDTSAHLCHSDRVKLSYERALAFGRLYKLQPEDILRTTSTYWEFHTDPMLAVDGAMATLLTIHFNLCCGTLAQFMAGRPDIADLLKRLLAFEIFGQYCLTELGHGLDVVNLETVATMQEDGGFELHTPHPRAAKFMPPTSPTGMPCIAVVFARLMVDGEDRGVKPFLVHMHNGYQMGDGIVSKVLSPRGGSSPVEHCLTSFHHVRLPSSALLGVPERAKDPRAQFFFNISRVAVGTLSIAASGIPVMKVASNIAARYSERRTVIDTFTRRPRPIISFPTQHIPILTALAQTFITESLLNACIAIFTDTKSDPSLRHCIAAIAKVVIMPLSQAALLSLSDRCGAQGLFAVNQMAMLHNDIRGATIAEGDILVLSIRFATEILIGRIELPPSTHTESALARHELHMMHELRSQMLTLSHHRDPLFETLIIPSCQSLLEAIGHRMAYDAARKDGIDEDIIDLYVASVLKADSAWYSEHGGIPLSEQRALEFNAVARLLPRLHQLLASLEVDEYCTAPIISDEKWDSYVQSLPTYGSETAPPLMRALL